MPRVKKAKVGDFVEIGQGRNGTIEYVPFLVTHVYDNDVVSGVAFSGEPGPLGWNNRGAQPFNSIGKGDGNAQWHFPGKNVTPDPELPVDDPPPADDPPVDDTQNEGNGDG